MRRSTSNSFYFPMALTVMFTCGSALAQQENLGVGSVSSATEGEITRGYLRDEMVGVKPAIGSISYTDLAGNTTGRGLLGVIVDANLASSMLPAGQRDWYIGPQSGLLYSHLGSTSSNFWGTSPSSPVGEAGSNIFMIPVNLKAGYTFTDSFRASAHGGGNVLYRSVASSLNLGSSSAQFGSTWDMFPNVGADLDFGFGSNVALSVRPDWTLTPGNDFFVGTIELGIALG